MNCHISTVAYFTTYFRSQQMQGTALHQESTSQTCYQGGQQNPVETINQCIENKPPKSDCIPAKVFTGIGWFLEINLSFRSCGFSNTGAISEEIGEPFV